MHPLSSDAVLEGLSRLALHTLTICAAAQHSMLVWLTTAVADQQPPAAAAEAATAASQGDSGCAVIDLTADEEDDGGSRQSDKKEKLDQQMKVQVGASTCQQQLPNADNSCVSQAETAPGVTSCLLQPQGCGSASSQARNTATGEEGPAGTSSRLSHQAGLPDQSSTPVKGEGNTALQEGTCMRMSDQGLVPHAAETSDRGPDQKLMPNQGVRAASFGYGLPVQATLYDEGMRDTAVAGTCDRMPDQATLLDEGMRDTEAGTSNRVPDQAMLDDEEVEDLCMLCAYGMDLAAVISCMLQQVEKWPGTQSHSTVHNSFNQSINQSVHSTYVSGVPEALPKPIILAGRPKPVKVFFFFNPNGRVHTVLSASLIGSHSLLQSQ